MLALMHGDVSTPRGVVPGGSVFVEHGRIHAVEPAGVAPPAAAQVLDLRGLRVLPGFVDLHVHGIEGQDALDCDAEGCGRLGRALARHGVTGFLPTLASSPMPLLEAALRCWGALPPTGGARVLGVHLEGPFLSPSMPGAMDAATFRRFDRQAWQRLCRAHPGLVRLVTLAVEFAENQEAITILRDHGIVPSVGHTAATYEQVSQAVGRGLRHATHTFNAMSPFHHRSPGTTGGVLVHDEVVAQVIADGYHVHPAALSLLFRVKGPDGVAAITDAAAPAGLPPGEWTWAGRRVLSDGKTVRLPGGTLAGSLLTMERALCNLVELAGIPFAAALEACTRTPALALGLGRQTGSLQPGLDADLVALDQDCRVRLTLVRGAIVYDALAGNGAGG